MNATSEAEMQFTITLKLSETEARALHELTTYGHKAFLEVYYKHLGQSMLKPHEKGIITLFDTAKRELPKHFKRIDSTKAAFTGKY